MVRADCLLVTDSDTELKTMHILNNVKCVKLWQLMGMR